MGALAISRAERDVQRIVDALLSLQQGRVDYFGTVTLRTGFATTVVPAPTAGVGNVVFLFPQTANAAAEVASGNLFVPPVSTAAQFTINHTNSGTAGRTFSWIVLG